MPVSGIAKQLMAGYVLLTLALRVSQGRVWIMRSVIRFAFVLGVLALSAAMAQTVRADETFDITWTGGYGPGSAVVTATDEGGGTFLVDSMSGTQNGASISTLDVPFFYGLNDNDIYPGSAPLVDVFGLAFDISGVDYNIFFFNDQYVECVSTVEPACLLTSEEEEALPLDSFTVTPATVAAPEPGSLLLLSLGLAGLLGAGIYTKRTFAGMPA
jgi:hypothetical protein